MRRGPGNEAASAGGAVRLLPADSGMLIDRIELERMKDMRNKDVIIALDFPTREETLAFLDRFPAGEKPFVKIGMELYYAEGPAIVREIKARGHKIFLDLKLHDIPNTVKRAMAVLSGLDVDMVNQIGRASCRERVFITV